MSSDLVSGPPPAIYSAVASEPPPAGEGDLPARADVAVIGGGITGLSAAYHLAATGASVVLLEAREIGWGASGRAFGQVVPYLKTGSAGILAHYGAERGERIVRDVGAGPDLVFELIEKHQIACAAVRTGLVFGAHSAAGRRSLEARVADWQRRGARIEMLDGDRAKTAVGSDYYAALCLDHRGGHLVPLAYARGLARAAVAAGAVLRTAMPVIRLERDGRAWRLEVAGGRRLAADGVVLATNAYTGDLVPGLGRSIVPLRGFGAVTEPLPDAALADVLPGGQPLTDTRRLFSGIRKLPGNRLLVSVDGPALGREGPPDLAKGADRVARLFPHLPAVKWAGWWSGWIAITADEFPRVHELGPRLYAGLGYSGRGLAAGTMIGRDIARRLAGAGEADVTFPLSPVRGFPARALAPAAIGGLIRAYRVLDAIDEARLRRHG